MKRCLTIVLLCLSLGAYAQEREAPVFRNRFTIEFSSGLPIIQSLNVNTRHLEKQLAMEGIRIDKGGALHPLINLTGALLVSPRCELALTGGIYWYLHRITQFEAFGIDPKGNPRFDTPVGSLTFQVRWIWNPGESCAIYSAAGAGILTEGTKIVPLPSITPVGVRLGGEHFFGFFETTLGSVATLFQAGLGWTF